MEERRTDYSILASQRPARVVCAVRHARRLLCSDARREGDQLPRQRRYRGFFPVEIVSRFSRRRGGRRDQKQDRKEQRTETKMHAAWSILLRIPRTSRLAYFFAQIAAAR